jgi:hypothetical protein
MSLRSLFQRKAVTTAHVNPVQAAVEVSVRISFSSRLSFAQAYLSESSWDDRWWRALCCSYCSPPVRGRRSLVLASRAWVSSARSWSIWRLQVS